MKRILFLKLGPFFVPTEMPIYEKYKWFSMCFNGNIFAVVHKRGLTHFKMHEFDLEGLYLPTFLRYMPFIRNILFWHFAIAKGIYLHYMKKKYDLIISGDPLMNGLLAYALSKMLRVKYLVEVNGNFKRSFEMGSEKRGFISRFKEVVSEPILRFVLKRAQGVKLLYVKQLESFEKMELLGKVACFHDFVPVGKFNPDSVSSKYILFLGYPWFLKGVDVLIKAFKEICLFIPDYNLKIVGFCPERAFFERLADGNSQIQLCHEVWYENAMKLIQECALFVLPSRTEAMGRVLIEAMASKKAIVASNVDGIPTYVKNGYNGLLFESENINDLGEKMLKVLKEPVKAKEMAENGYKQVHSCYSEVCYLNSYKDFIEKVIDGEYRGKTETEDL